MSGAVGAVSRMVDGTPFVRPGARNSGADSLGTENDRLEQRLDEMRKLATETFADPFDVRHVCAGLATNLLDERQWELLTGHSPEFRAAMGRTTFERWQVAQTLRAKMSERALDAATVARRLGMEPEFVDRLLAGSAALRRGVLEALAKVLDLPAEDLLPGDDFLDEDTGLTLAEIERRRANISPALRQRLAPAGAR